MRDFLNDCIVDFLKQVRQNVKFETSLRGISAINQVQYNDNDIIQNLYTFENIFTSSLYSCKVNFYVMLITIINMLYIRM